jgi:hypothetical protein
VTSLVLALLAGTATWLVVGGVRDRRRYRRCDERRRQEAWLRILAASLPEPPTAADSREQPGLGTGWRSADPGAELRIAAQPPRAQGQAGAGLSLRSRSVTATRTALSKPPSRSFVPPV